MGTTSIGLRYPELSDSPNALTAVKNLADDVNSQIIHVFNSTGSRDTAFPSPSEGQYCYISATGFNNKQLYTGGSWINVYEEKRTVVRTNNSTRTSTTTTSADNQLFVSVLANRTYAVLFCPVLEADFGGDLKFNFSYPSGASYYEGMIAPDSATNTASSIWGAATQGRARTEDASTPSSDFTIGGRSDTTPSSNPYMPFYRGLLVVGSTSGTLQLNWAQGTSSVNASTIYKGSHLILDRVA